MNTNRSMAWLREAVGGIKYPPDRRRVEKELYAHVMQRNRDFLKEGCTEREADEKACAVMGDPVEVRRDLAAIHRPFWGYTFLILRLLLFAVAVWGVLFHMSGFLKLGQYLVPLSAQAGMTPEQWISQNGKAHCGDYTFRLCRAAYAADESGQSWLLLELQATTPDPLLGGPFYSALWDQELQDSRGRVYSVKALSQKEPVFNTRILLGVQDMEPGADWAVLTLPGPEGPAWLTVRLKEGSG